MRNGQEAPTPMHAVAIEAAPDPFGRAEARFAEIVTKLRSQEMGEMDLGELERSLPPVATKLFAEAQHRQAQQARRWVVLVDGNEAQHTNLLALGDLHGVKLTVIIDVIHVIESLWRAGRAFEREGRKKFEAWVRTRLQRVLEGGASDVATGLRRLSTRRKLGTKQRAPVDTCANYLDKYAEFLRYDAYLATRVRGEGPTTRGQIVEPRELHPNRTALG
jgi:hypothetical protein